MPVAAVKPEPEPEKLGLDDLTAAETALAERTVGQSIATLGNPKYPTAGLLGALGWVLHRRTDSKLGYDKYMASRTLAEITKELRLSGDDEDAEGEGDGSTSSS